MLSDDQMITLMVNEPSWEDVIVKVVADEKMDPWDIDICSLADAFLVYMNKLDKVDMRVPARFILIAAILLRMKSDILISKKKRILLSEGDKPQPKWYEIAAQLPPLQPPIKRVPLGNVTLDELMTALKKAFEVKERRKKRKLRMRRVVEDAMPLAPTDDITDRISELYDEIQSAILEIEEGVEFSKLVKDWKRDNIVKTLMPILHLSQEGRVTIEQEELFKEIYVKLRKAIKDGKKEKE